MFNLIRRKIIRYKQRRTFQEYGHKINHFTLPQDGSLEYAQWLHPFESEKVFTQDNIDFYRSFLKKGDVAIDIGAHTGDTTVPMAFAVGSEGCVLAIEPNKYVFKVLHRNSELNTDKTNIVPLNFAVTDQDGQFNFNYSDASFCNGGFLSEINSQSHNHNYILSVTGKNLPSFLRANYSQLLGRIRLIKIDAEGYDKEIIKSIADLIAVCHPVLIAECYKKLTAAERFDLYDTVKSLRYNIYHVDNFHTENKIEIKSRDEMLNWSHMDMIMFPE